MKNILKFSFVLLSLQLSCVPPQKEVPEEPHTVVSYQVFYDDLAPYGHWIHHPSLGYVWLPMDDPDFLPYSSHGHWVWTDYGWTWVSEYPWGWAPFHYGRWDYDPHYGWFWIPDNVWGPGWVVWLEYPGYYGWAPIRPGIGITIVIGGGYHPPDVWWTFCGRKYFGRHDMHRHFEPRKKLGRIRDGESRIIDNTIKGSSDNQIFLSGPGRDNVQREIDEPIEKVTITNNNKPGETLDKTTWNVYRPNIQQAPPNTVQPAPKTVTPSNDAGKTYEGPPAMKIPNAPRPEPSVKERPKITPPPRENKEPNVTPRVPQRETPRSVEPRKESVPKQTPRDAAPKSTPKESTSKESTPRQEKK